MATEKFTQPPSNQGGVNVRLVEVVNSNGVPVEMQVVVLGDPNNPSELVSVGPSLANNALAVTIAPDQPTTIQGLQYLVLNGQQQTQLMMNSSGGFVPLPEILPFL